jgi:predicted  nucleic acid-binding Zn-ribbon protein
LGVQEGHADAVTALQASITQLERQRDDAVKQLTKEQDALAAIRAAQETAKATLASLQDQITEAHALIAQGQAFQKDLADFRKKAAAMAPS